MKIVSLVARILLGLLFLMSGISIFLPMKMPPPPPGLAGEWQSVYFASHYVYFVDVIQAIAALLVLFNRYATLGLVVLAAIITNIFIFHITMAPSGLVVAVITAVFWALAALPYRRCLEPLFTARPVTEFQLGEGR